MSDLTRIEAALSSIHHSFEIRGHSRFKSVRQALLTLLPQIDPESWNERFDFGGIYLNGRTARPEQEILGDFLLEYYEPKFKLNEAKSFFAQFSKDWIVFEDEDLIATYKPAKLPCGQNREQKYYYLRGYVESYLGRSVHMPSRLDTSAQGLVLFSKSKRMHKVLQQAFERHTIQKYYALDVAPAVGWKAKEVKNQIGQSPAHPVLRMIVPSGGEEASTFFQRIINQEDSTLGVQSSLLLAKPKTGRTHQLRVQCADLGSPIIGDMFYNGVEAQDLRLVSYKFVFHDPLRKIMRTIVAPTDKLPPWALGIVRPEG